MTQYKFCFLFDLSCKNSSTEFCKLFYKYWICSQISRKGLHNFDNIVQVQKNAKPPVCKIMDYHKEQYKQQEKEKERAKSKVQFCCYLPVKILDKDIT